MRKPAFVLGIVFICATLAAGQRPEVTVSLNEAFFDSLLDSIFQNAPPLEFPIALNASSSTISGVAAFAPRAACRETIQLLRENNGVRTAVRFRDGKILAPIAFSGNYNPPLVGCVGFSGFAETSIELEFDQANQRLVARAKVLNVSLNGTGGLGGSLIAKMVQGSIDRKVNPIEVFTMEKISFLVPVRSDVNLRLKAAAVRHEIANNMLNIVISYDLIRI